MRREFPNRFQDAKHGNPVYLCRINRFVKRGPDKTLRRQIVKLVWGEAPYDPGDLAGLENLQIDDLNALKHTQLSQAPGTVRRRPSHASDHTIAQIEKVTREIGPILSKDACNQRRFAIG